MKRKIKVLHCLQQVYSGGVEQSRLQLARGLSPDRYEQRILCTLAPGPIADDIRAAGVEITELGHVRSVFEPHRYREAARIIRAWQPDIVHGAVFEGFTVAAVAGRMTRSPRIVLEETSDPLDRSWKGNLLFRLLAGMSHECIGISPAVGVYLREVARIPEDKITVINYGATRPSEPTREAVARKKAEWGIEDSDLVIGSVGRMDNDQKRFEDLISAFALLDRSLRAKLLLVGDGRDRPQLQRHAQALGVSDRVVFAGYQYDTGLMYSLMDVFSLASDREAFGLVLVEAMLYGLPVVAARAGGMKDIVLDGETGFLVPPKAPPALAEALGKVLRDAEGRKRMGAAGYRRAVENFTAERFVRNMDEFYGSLVGAS